MNGSDHSGATRRDLLRSGARLALAVPLAAASSAALLAGCGPEDERQYKRTEPRTPEDWKPKPVEPTAPAVGATEPVSPTTSQTEPVTSAPAEPVEVAAPVEPAAGGGSFVTDLASAAPMVAALQYTNDSPKPDQNCDGCQLFTATDSSGGKCQLFPVGLVKVGGWCASWAPRAS